VVDVNFHFLPRVFTPHFPYTYLRLPTRRIRRAPCSAYKFAESRFVNMNFIWIGSTGILALKVPTSKYNKDSQASLKLLVKIKH